MSSKMKISDVMSLLDKKSKLIAGDFYRANVNAAMYHVDKTWFSTGFRELVTKSVNYALEATGKTERIELLNSNTANGVASRIN